MYVVDFIALLDHGQVFRVIFVVKLLPSMGPFVDLEFNMVFGGLGKARSEYYSEGESKAKSIGESNAKGLTKNWGCQIW